MSVTGVDGLTKQRVTHCPAARDAPACPVSMSPDQRDGVKGSRALCVAWVPRQEEVS